MKYGIVIPTIRPEKFQEWFKAWEPVFKDKDVVVYVVEDNPKKTIKIPKNSLTVKHYSWKEIDKDLKGNAWIIPRRCDSIRSYGYLKAYQDKCDYIVTLDDDVLPIDNNYLDIIDINFYDCNNISKYFDVGDMFKNSYQYMRGVPFKNRKDTFVVLQYGGWDNVPDLGATEQLEMCKVDGFEFKREIQVVPNGLGCTCCIMNAAWKRDITPLLYQLLMGDEHGHPFKRWGDIWSGLFAKKVLDHLGMSMAINGEASVYHTRASDPIKNLKEECSGYGPNETLWDNLQLLQLKSDNIEDCYLEIAHWIVQTNPFDNEKYSDELGVAMKTWIGLLL